MEKDYPAPRQYGSRCISRINLGMRKRIQELLEEGTRVKDICKILGISRGALWYERQRVPGKYDALEAEEDAKYSLMCNPRRSAPTRDIYNLNFVYKTLLELKKNKFSKEKKQSIQECIYRLEQMGVLSHKVKRAITLDEQIEIIDLWKSGKSINRISVVMNRSRSSVEGVLLRYQEKLNQPLEEIKNERIKDKWSNPQNKELQPVQASGMQ